MNCEWVRANITLYVYDEMSDDARYELEQHVERCRDCAAELLAMRAFKGELASEPMMEPMPNLLAAARMRLQEALETAAPNRAWQNWILEPMKWFGQMKLAPAAAALLFILGFGSGIGVAWRAAVSGRAPAQRPADSAMAAPTTSAASILGIRGIMQKPGSNQVDIKYDSVVPQTATGSLTDPRIQQLLLFAARNNTNSGLRVDSVDLLAQKTMAQNERVRRALMYELRFDSNPGVRLKALKGLGPFVKDDAQVRDAVLTALMHDSNPGVRTEAIEWLKPVSAENEVQQVLGHLAEEDQNTSIRNLSRVALESAPHFD